MTIGLHDDWQHGAWLASHANEVNGISLSLENCEVQIGKWDLIKFHISRQIPSKMKSFASRNNLTCVPIISLATWQLICSFLQSTPLKTIRTFLANQISIQTLTSSYLLQSLTLEHLPQVSRPLPK